MSLLEKCMQVKVEIVWFVSQDHVERSLDGFLQCFLSERGVSG
jgi:hypothetical protein